MRKVQALNGIAFVLSAVTGVEIRERLWAAACEAAQPTTTFCAPAASTASLRRTRPSTAMNTGSRLTVR